MSNEKLLPCPVCGSDDVDERGWLSGDGGAGPQCMNCGTTAEPQWWNARPAIKALQQQLSEAEAARDEIANDAKDAITTLEARIKELENPWISVEERLPDFDTPVFVCFDGEGIHGAARFYDEGESVWYWTMHTGWGCDLRGIENYEADDEYTPSHWRHMPLPPIPKESSDE